MWFKCRRCGKSGKGGGTFEERDEKDREKGVCDVVDLGAVEEAARRQESGSEKKSATI